MSPRVPAAKEIKSVDKRHFEDLPKASANQPGQVGIPRSRPTDLEKDSEDRRSDLRGKSHRRRESQTRNPQISAAPTSQRQHSTAPNVSTVSEGNSGNQLALLDTFGPTAAFGLHQPSSLRPSLPRPPRLKSTMTALLTLHFHPPLPQHLLRRLLYPPPPRTPTTIKITIVNTNDEDSVLACPDCDHLRIHHTETGELVSEAPTYTRHTYLNCSAHSLTAWAY
nr:unnamed protein product [Spirometra erinaceieuropaei]